jgi:hypothetical protein
MIVPIKKVKVKKSWWQWMGGVDEHYEGEASDILHYKNIAFFKNWADMGIAYAYPDIQEDWYAVVNHENEEGIVRIGDNKNSTPGMKFWTFGFSQSYNADYNKLSDWQRPFVELWSGVNKEFFHPVIFPKQSEKNWDEYFYPIIDLDKISYANKDAAIYYNIENGKIISKIFTTSPGKDYILNVVIKDTSNKEIYSNTKEFISDAVKASIIDFGNNKIKPGSYVFEVILTDKNKNVILNNKREVSVK